jgi:hypothetical protein
MRVERLCVVASRPAARSANSGAPAPARSQFNAVRGVRVVTMASWTGISADGIFPPPARSSAPVRRRNAQRAHRPRS